MVRLLDMRSQILPRGNEASLNQIMFERLAGALRFRFDHHFTLASDPFGLPASGGVRALANTHDGFGRIFLELHGMGGARVPLCLPVGKGSIRLDRVGGRPGHRFSDVRSALAERRQDRFAAKMPEDEDNDREVEQM